MISNTEPLAGQGQDFARFVQLQQHFTDKRNDLDALEVKINLVATKAAGMNAEAYVVLQEEVATLEAELTAMFEKHPEWRGPNKSVKTPYGDVAQRKVAELEVANPAVTVTLIKAMFAEAAKDFLHIKESPNLEALEGLGDSELAKLGISRKTREQITVKPFKVNVAKAVKAAKAQV